MKNNLFGFFVLILLSLLVLGCTTTTTPSAPKTYSVEGIWEIPGQANLGGSGRYVQTISKVSDSHWQAKLDYLSATLTNDYGFSVGDVEFRNLVRDANNANKYTGEAYYRYSGQLQAPIWRSGTLTVSENTAVWSVPGRSDDSWIRRTCPTGQTISAATGDCYVPS